MESKEYIQRAKNNVIVKLLENMAFQKIEMECMLKEPGMVLNPKYKQLRDNLSGLKHNWSEFESEGINAPFLKELLSGFDMSTKDDMKDILNNTSIIDTQGNEVVVQEQVVDVVSDAVGEMKCG